MKITAVKITPVLNEVRLKAYVSITIDNCFIVHDLKIIHTDDKMFIAMPSKKHKNLFQDIAHPLDKDTRTQIEQAVISEYKKTLENLRSETQAIDTSS